MSKGGIAAPTGFVPLGMRRELAALYIGVSPRKFDQLVEDGRMPQPKLIDGCVVWDRTLLDICFQALPDRQAESVNLWD